MSGIGKALVRAGLVHPVVAILPVALAVGLASASSHTGVGWALQALVVAAVASVVATIVMVMRRRLRGRDAAAVVWLGGLGSGLGFVAGIVMLVVAILAPCHGCMS